jgi:rubredoxin
MERTFVCNHCDAAFLSFDELIEHQQLVADANAWDDDWLCPVCADHFVSPGQLAAHYEKEH